MTRPANPVEPGKLAAAFIILVEKTPPRTHRVAVSEEQGTQIWEAIRTRLKVDARTTSDLFRRALALSNFFVSPANRRRFGVDTRSLPRREIWRAAATSPVYQKIIEGLAWEVFDPDEFSAVLRPVTDLDIYRAARLLVDQRGAAAGFAASKAADELLEEGDLEGSKAWRRIGVAVEELTRWPCEGESIN